MTLLAALYALPLGAQPALTIPPGQMPLKLRPECSEIIGGCGICQWVAPPVGRIKRWSASLPALPTRMTPFNNSINTRLQLNGRNILENGRLQAVSYYPDGNAWNFRIIDPRQFILTATFDL